MSLKETLTAYWLHIQGELLPWLDDTTCGPLNGHHRQLVSVLGMIRIEAFSGRPAWPSWASALRARRPGEGLYREGRIQHSDYQPADRDAVRRQDVAPLMWLAARGRGAERVDVFAGFRGVRRERFAIAVARGADPRHSIRIVWSDISRRDSTAIEAREKPAKSKTSRQRNQNAKLKRGRPRKGERLRSAARRVRIERANGA